MYPAVHIVASTGDWDVGEADCCPPFLVGLCYALGTFHTAGAPTVEEAKPGCQVFPFAGGVFSVNKALAAALGGWHMLVAVPVGRAFVGTGRAPLRFRWEAVV